MICHQPQKIIDELKKWDVTHVIGLPDNGSAKLYEKLRGEPEINVISVTREGEAFAIASGLYVGGKQPVVLIQNTGFLESGDAIRGTAVNMEIPLVTLIGYRGYQTLRPESRLHSDSAATFLEPTLKAWGFPTTASKPMKISITSAKRFRKRKPPHYQPPF